MAFLWVGVNDAGDLTSWTFQVANWLLGQPRARDLAEFRATYRRLLDRLCRDAGRVIAVAPALKGEDVGNRWNQELGVLARTIEGLAADYERADYLDLRAVFAEALARRRIADYTPDNALRVALDIVTLRNDAQVDRRAARRGLHLTLDGVHLNSTGAALVAEAFLRAIEMHHPHLTSRVEGEGQDVGTGPAEGEE